MFHNYTQMLIEDHDTKFGMFKYLAMLTNPEGFKQIENIQNPQRLVEKQKFESGKQADKHFDKLLEQIKKNRQNDVGEQEGIEIG